MKKLKRGAFFTDIHFGKKTNSEQHNQDCLNFIDWFCAQVKKDGHIDYVAFLGDWNENRSALNISTLNYSYIGAKKLDALGIPVYFVIGNHDLYQRYSREIHSIVHFQEFKNFRVMDQPTIINEIEGKALFSPYMFHEEYPDLAKFLSIPFWAGHFEFKGFETSSGNIMAIGPEGEMFKGPKHIISGHFHKRQAKDNIIYMGNTFPMDFGDAGDANGRGLMIYDHVKQEPTWTDWDEAPQYIKTLLSSVIDKKIVLPKQSRVKCLVDFQISFDESSFLRKTFMEKNTLREFVLEEPQEIAEAMTDTKVTMSQEQYDKLSTVDELVKQMLTDIESDHLDNQMLIDIYTNLKTQ